MLNKERFFARKDVLKTIDKRVSSFTQGYRQNIAIIGDELVGKTSVIKYYLQNHLSPEVIPVYICMNSLQKTYFVKQFCGVLLYNFLHSKGIGAPNKLDYLITTAKQYIPQTASKIEYIVDNLDKQKSSIVFQSLFDLPDIFTKETQCLCIVIFDEFHNLEDQAGRSIFQELGKRIMLQKSVMYVFISSMKIKARKIIENELSLLFGNFENIQMEHFDYSTAEEFITKNLHPINTASIYKEFMINLSGGNPYYLDVLCQELNFISRIRDKTTLSLEDIVGVFENLLFNPLGKLNTCFDSKLSVLISSKASENTLDTLLAIASGVSKLKDIAVCLGKTKKEILQRLNKFSESNIVSQNGTFYKINDKIFSFWLKAVYKVHRDYFHQDLDSLKKIFQEELQAIFDVLSAESRKKTIDRIIDLFNLFKDDSVQVESRRIRLADFKEIKFLSFDSSNMRMLIVAKDKQDTSWVTFLKEGIITEEDVIEFAKHIKNNDDKVRRKIVIGLSDIDPNARLKALKEKMLIWDRRNVNQLFELYGRPML